jgi:hypothetical protein
MNRPASGRFELTMPVNDDFIPAGPGWNPNILPSLHADVERRPCDVRSTFDKETGELIMSLQWSEPEKEKPAINDAIKFAKRQGVLRRIVISVAQEIYGTTESFQFFKRNGFTRNEGREQGGFITLEKEAKSEEISETGNSGKPA